MTIYSEPGQCRCHGFVAKYRIVKPSGVHVAAETCNEESARRIVRSYVKDRPNERFQIVRYENSAWVEVCTCFEFR